MVIHGFCGLCGGDLYPLRYEKVKRRVQCIDCGKIYEIVGNEKEIQRKIF